MEIKKVSEGFEEKCHEKYDPEQIREHWLEVDKIIKDCNNSIMEMGLPDIGYTSQVDPIHEYCDELINLNSYIRSAYGSVYEWLDYPLWLDFKNGVTEAISQVKAEEITTKNIMGIGGYSDTPLAKGYQWGAMPAKELTLSDFMNLMPDEAVKNGFKVQGIQGMKAFQVLFQEEYEAKKKESPDLEDPRSYFEDMLVKGQEEHSDYHPFLDLLQTVLDVAGFIPGIGEPADFVNAVLYAGRGDKINAALSASAAIPMIGNFAAGGKVVTKGKKVVKVVKKIKKGSALTKGAGGADEFSELYRKVQNTGNLKDLEELMQLKNVKKIVQEAGIGLDDIKIKIDRSPELIGTGYCGYTSPDGKTITLYPDAFTNTESLVKTLGHERIHIYQINTFGVPQDVDMGRLFENDAWGSEKDWWNYYNMNGGLK